MEEQGRKKRALFGPAAGTVLAGLCLALLARIPLSSAGAFEGAEYGVLPGVVNSGGSGQPASASHNLIAGAGEIGRSSYTSANHILQPGYANLAAWPGTVTDLFASTGAAGGSLALA